MGVKVKEWKGAWWLQINHQGRRKSKRVGVGKAAKKAAELAAVQIQAKLASGDSSVFADTRRREQTFREFAEQWLATEIALRLKPATQENYRMALTRHWLPALGSLPLAAITRDRIRAVLAEKRAATPQAAALKASTL